MKSRYHILSFLLALSIFGLLNVCQALGSQEKDYSDFVKTLQSKIQEEPFKGASYERLAYITDTFGPRLWGSEALETVIRQLKGMAEKEGFDNVHLEEVSNFTRWVRGHQSLTLYSPRPQPTKLGLIGLGGTVSGDVRAEVIVVKDYEELDAKKDLVREKIVCFANSWTTYGETVKYRSSGPINAAKYGAVGVLIRSVTPESVYSVHTGITRYSSEYPKIPAAAITVEDAEMFARMQKRGQRIVVHLNISSQEIPHSNSNNLIFEIKGTEKPDEVILAGGHIDSWDTGPQTGANDDGGGFVTVFEALRLLLKNGFRPKRTLRFIAWSGEEFGNPRNGAHQYLERHIDEIDKHVAAFESDLGSTKLVGFGHSGQGVDVFKSVLENYMSILGASEYSDDGQSVDVGPLYAKGVPIIKNLIEDTPDHKFYFRYHHSAGDSMSIMNPADMDSNVVGIAALLYILADLETSLRSPLAIQNEI